jgi:MFS family permease
MTTPDTDTVSPRALLVLFCSLNLLIYLDRGAISSNGVNSDGIQRAFEPTLFQDGLLPAAFMVGLLLSSPVFATLSMKRHPLRLIGYGLGVWAASVFLCGCSIGFWNLVACRMAVGIGEASFVALASPFIDDNAPKEHKALWLGMFFACIPVGYALGFLYGGTVAGLPLCWSPSS